MKQHFGNYIGTRLVAESQPVVAWRSWAVRRVWWGLLWELRGVSNGVPWPMGRPLAAACNADGKQCVVALGETCTCGIWASKSLKNLVSHNAFGVYPTAVFGRVALWGFLHEYEGGFRAAVGRPLELWTGVSAATSARRGLATAYGVPVHLDIPADLLEPLASPDPIMRPEPRQIEDALRAAIDKARGKA